MAELRRSGIKISDKWCKDHHGRRYKSYWIGTEEPEDEQRA